MSHDVLLESLNLFWLVAGPKIEWQRPSFKFFLNITVVGSQNVGAPQNLNFCEIESTAQLTKYK